jgi:hypothetical protein
MIKFVTGYSGYGGSTIMLIQHCKLLEKFGCDVELYGFQNWHMDRYKHSRMMQDFSYDPDDILVYHFLEPSSKPNCKKTFLFIQETSLYNVHKKPTELFDEVVFASEWQRDWHKFDGKIMPNRMNGLVDKSLHSPPKKNVAGIVGNIHPIKNPEISISKAMRDGASEILLFGPIMDNLNFHDYLERYVPIYDERVKYAGFFDPDQRMDMYNQFDVLYHFGEFESACITLGECRILGKDVIKGEKLHDYPILSDEEIFECWKKLID